MFINSIPDLDTAIMRFLDLDSLGTLMRTCTYALKLIGSAEMTRDLCERDRFKKWLKTGQTEYKVADDSYIYAAWFGGRRIFTASHDPLASRICPGALKTYKPKITTNGDKLYLSAHGTVWSVIKYTVNKHRGTSLVKNGEPVTLAMTQHDGVDDIIGTEYNYTIKTAANREFTVYSVDRGQKIGNDNTTTEDTHQSWILVNNSAVGKYERRYYCMIDQQPVLAPLEPLVVAFLATHFDPTFQWLI